MYSYTATQYYYSACGHGDHQNHLSDIFSESQVLNPCSLPGKCELVENRVCWQCWHSDFKSSPLPLADRESETIKFLLFKGQVDLYHSEINQQNKVLEEELCILTPESLSLVQVRQLHLLHHHLIGGVFDDGDSTLES
jgi:hypothetical protein